MLNLRTFALENVAHFSAVQGALQVTVFGVKEIRRAWKQLMIIVSINFTMESIVLLWTLKIFEFKNGSSINTVEAVDLFCLDKNSSSNFPQNSEIFYVNFEKNQGRPVKERLVSITTLIPSCVKKTKTNLEISTT